MDEARVLDLQTPSCVLKLFLLPVASKHTLKHLEWLTNTHNSIRVLRFRVWDSKAGNEVNMKGLMCLNRV